MCPYAKGSVSDDVIVEKQKQNTPSDRLDGTDWPYISSKWRRDCWYKNVASELLDGSSSDGEGCGEG